MKCPECGFELADDQLYCEHCGKEIQIVPDFEPEIENSIIETLSTVAEEIEPKHNNKLTPDTMWNNEPKQQQSEPKAKKRIGLIIGVVSFIALLVIAAVIGIQIYRVYSVPYQMEQAGRYADAEDYGRAAGYMERADELLPDNPEIKNTLAAYYYLDNAPDRAVDTLMEVVNNDRLTPEEQFKSYERLIAILDELQRYSEISELLLNCEDGSLVTRFQFYLAKVPEFSLASGSYSEVLLLKLNSNTAGAIYYTMNGSRPTQNSKVYTAPIYLETGEYIVSAMFVNEYGIESDVVSQSYQIDLQIPDPPVIGSYSGLYTEPTMIEVELPPVGAVYYTTDGSVPTTGSSQYTNPIPMPYGRTEFRFAVISEQGGISEVISRIYELRLLTEVTPQAAVAAIMEALVERQVLTDMTGKAAFEEGYYEFAFDELIEIPGKGLYFKVDEYYRVDAGVREITEHLYVVEAYTGMPNRLIYNEMGEMDLIALK
ncbi:MAG: chitobiase/beta-hexosaminidase C-terminal domain-containing protein [Lachnospiraceae bacterium]|jgi:tetratricopeptide (TPR) repeat protein|nr:chitobiase/beta-hexosaminidase C-terminal domain-containing protein [Lachnospiraceae bacterium]